MTHQRKELKLGVFGLGCVGTGLHEVLLRTPGLKAQIKKFCVKHPNKPRPVPAEYITFKKEDILYDPEINVVVELIDDAEAAWDIVREALLHGKAVVTANKKMLAERLQEVIDLQKQTGLPVLYEAACCASIPIIRNLEEYYDNDLLESVEGIVNGSTNYILTQTAREGLSYAEALADAQQWGYAESNPVLDTGGFDAKYKLQLLLLHSFGIIAKPDDILHFGIDRLGATELAYAREKGYKIKLIASAFISELGKLSAWVMPKFVGPESRFYNVDDVYNGVETRTCFSDLQFFTGKGAGAHPTASAVLSDISALSYDYRYEYKKLHQEGRPKWSDDIYIHILLRFTNHATRDYRSFFTEIYETHMSRGDSYITGIMSGKQLKLISETEASPVLIEVPGRGETMGAEAAWAEGLN